MRVSTLALLLVSLASATASVDAQGWVVEDPILASDAVAGDEFSSAIAASDGTLMVGAPDLSTPGAVYVYAELGGDWIEQQILYSSSVSPYDDFGRSIAIEGDIAVVGAPLTQEVGLFSGSAYVFRFDGTSWVEEQALFASDAAENDRFGEAVAISGDVILIGAFANDDQGLNSGSAYSFRFDGTSWIEEQKLTASDADSDDNFGDALAIQGDFALISSPREEGAGNDTGAVYAFEYDGVSWVQQQKFYSLDPGLVDLFGGSISIDGARAIIGAQGDRDLFINGGSAYIFGFDGTTWSQEQKITPGPQCGEWDRFGESVSIDGNAAIVGAGEYNNGPGKAMIYRFDGATWTEEAVLTSGTTSIVDFFGGVVFMHEAWAFVGAPYEDYGGMPNVGVLRAYRSSADFSRGDCNSDGLLDVADPVLLLAVLFVSGTVPCQSACDANDDGLFDVSDAVFALSGLFAGGPGPTAPVFCGPDPTSDGLGCIEYTACP